jgi:hypothetical protein
MIGGTLVGLSFVGKKTHHGAHIDGLSYLSKYGFEQSSLYTAK